jgi:molecular chaperone DnaK
LKAEAQAKAEELRTAIANPRIGADDMRQQIENFQQTLFVIGAAVYQQANRSREEYYDQAETVAAPPPGEYIPSTPNEEEEFNFDLEDNTVSADYEAVD